MMQVPFFIKKKYEKFAFDIAGNYYDIQIPMKEINKEQKMNFKLKKIVVFVKEF